MPKSNLAELKIGQEEKERSQQKEDEHNEESNRGIRPDLEAEILKRARMEVDGELATQEGNEGNTKTDGGNTGLQGQPGESK